MNTFEFARKYFEEYKQHGNEIIPKYCPYCHGGENKDKYSFALNVDKQTFNCKRGSCAKQGHFSELCRDFGETADREEKYEFRQVKKPFVKPTTAVNPAKSKVENYLKLRGFSQKTWERRGVGEYQGNIAYPYYENGELVLMKFRKPEKYTGKGMKAWREEGGRAVLWGMDLCESDTDLVICEGECFPGDAEILTETGWIQFEMYSGQKIMQVNEDLTGEFVYPIGIINKPFNGDLLAVRRGGNYASITTPEHNIVYRDHTGKICKKAVSRMPKTIRGNIPTVIRVNGKGINLTETQIALCLAVSADSRIDYRENGSKYARFAFKKERKIIRLTSILDRLKINYSCNEISNGYTSICFTLPEWCIERFFPNSWINEATYLQRLFILKEIVNWDGNLVPNRDQREYSTKYLSNAIFIQTMAHTAGMMSTVMKRKNGIGNWFKVSILLNKTYVSWANIYPEKVKHDNQVYCVTVPSGMILVRQEGHITVTGNCDALALDECGVKNVLSVPSGAKDLSWIDNCWDWLKKYENIVFWGDNDDPGKEMVKKCTLRLSDWKCYVVDSKHKDANISLIRDGKEKTKEAVINAKLVPINGLIDLADVTKLDIEHIPRVRSGLVSLDREIGGFMMGELSVWTGKSGQGKSTLLGQILLDSIQDGANVCAYSGELRADCFQYWINLQAAGVENIKSYDDPVKQSEIAYVPKEINKKICDWYRGRFWLYDNDSNNDETGILKIFSYAAKRYDCKVFLVDNLMTSNFDCKNENDYYRAQSGFVGELIHFAKSFGVHVHLVAHPKKSKGDLNKEDISGTGDIANRAHNVFSVDRIEEEGSPVDTVLTILKNRFYGVQNVKIGLHFNKTSKRFYGKNGVENKKYGWEGQTEKHMTMEDFGKEISLGGEF